MPREVVEEKPRALSPDVPLVGPKQGRAPSEALDKGQKERLEEAKVVLERAHEFMKHLGAKDRAVFDALARRIDDGTLGDNVVLKDSLSRLNGKAGIKLGSTEAAVQQALFIYYLVDRSNRPFYQENFSKLTQPQTTASAVRVYFKKTAQQ